MHRTGTLIFSVLTAAHGSLLRAADVIFSDPEGPEALTSAACIHIMKKVNATHLTVRRVPHRLASALEREKKRRGKSLNQTVIDLLEQSLGVTATHGNGVERFVGGWTQEEHREFLDGIASFGEIDRDFWK